ncbi:ABC transporter permease [Criibacterium bergeronii]|uniref:ABC transporter permease n=1 Tax=Criibacterium bergeronii TaxID=1871336 RepID=A0A371IKH3_9FIRM|nr:ABC transporter [Criibacterium bergeronii]MBS6063846.1 ABC transporter permease [Peptostreptococcaceae bacterium]RDY20950.1 ABC transporter permease [Criibacterium bergeronii]
MGLFLGSLEQGLIYAVLAMGVFISFKVLDIADMSVEGSFPFGAFIFAALVTIGVNPIVAMCVAFLGGMIAGYITAILFIKLKITPLLAGILTLNIFYSINLATIGRGKSNLPLFSTANIFPENKLQVIFLLILICLVIKILMDIFFKTEVGYLIVATGDNEKLVRTLGQNSNKYKILGLMISNGLVALSGSLMAQSSKFADATMGTGIIVYALASIIIGDTILKNSKYLNGTTRAIIGAIAYKLIWGIALFIGLPSNYLKATTALIVIAFIAYNNAELSSKFLNKKSEKN